MDVGVFTEFSWAPGTDEAIAFDHSMAEMVAAEHFGYDSVWLAELHFQKERSVLASPLVIGAGIAARTTRIRIGIAVQVLPIAHPLHLAEDVATLDHLSKGRLDFGIGRSGQPSHYSGFDIKFEESRERFDETLAILVKAWTEDRFTHEGRFHSFHDVCIVPKPYQKPYPPLRIAATTEETYAQVGRTGLPIFLAVRTSSISELTHFIGGYRAGRREAGHEGPGEVGVIVPVYVAESDRRAREEAEPSTAHFFRTIGEALSKGPRREVGERLRSMSAGEMLREFAVYGSPESVTERLLALREVLGYSTLAAWMNVGAKIPHERVMASMRLFAERVIPRLA